MKNIIIFLITFCPFSSFGQSLAILEERFYSKLNTHHGFDLHAYKENGKIEFIYNTYAWFNFTMDRKLEYSIKQVYVSENGKRESSYKTTIRFADITLFEYKGIEYKEYQSSDGFINEEKIISPMLIIHYIENGKQHELIVGFQIKGEKNVIHELNQLIKEIQKKL
jgi:hypothetical protein